MHYELACSGLGLLCAGATCRCQACNFHGGRVVLLCGQWQMQLPSHVGTAWLWALAPHHKAGLVSSTRHSTGRACNSGTQWCYMAGGHCGTCGGDKELQTASGYRCLGKVCLSLMSFTAVGAMWLGCGIWAMQHGKACHGDARLGGCTPARTIGSP